MTGTHPHGYRAKRNNSHPPCRGAAGTTGVHIDRLEEPLGMIGGKHVPRSPAPMKSIGSKKATAGGQMNSKHPAPRSRFTAAPHLSYSHNYTGGPTCCPVDPAGGRAQRVSEIGGAIGVQPEGYTRPAGWNVHRVGQRCERPEDGWRMMKQTVRRVSKYSTVGINFAAGGAPPSGSPAVSPP